MPTRLPFYRRRWLTTTLLIAVIVGLFFSSALVIWAATLPIPDFASFQSRLVPQSTKIYDRTGKVLLYDVHGTVRRTQIELEEIATSAKAAAISIEDESFYSHQGISPKAILRAVVVNFLSGKYEQGGSTITQQVVKNSLLTNEKTLTRKLKEWILALKLERTLSKDEILSRYLNEIPYGGNIYGIEEASKVFFGKDATDLSIAEAAYLAALPQAPTYYSPYGNHKDKLDERKDIVLEKMHALGYIGDADYTAAKAEVVHFLPPDSRGIKAPHFVFYIIGLLEEKYGKEAVESRGFKVITTLDWELQQKAEATIQKFADANEKNWNATNEGLVAIDPKTGQILAMVGSRDYFDIEHEGNFNVTTASRQPGSSFKPFVYAAAFMKGYTPETILFDVPTQFDTACTSGGNCYSPQNYDEQFRGPMTIRHALAQSINIPAIKALYLVGVSNAIQTARALGISTLGRAETYGLTLVLGGGEVTLLDMTSAYSVFANDGVRNPATGILRVENENGLVEEFSPKPTEVLPANVARQISSILSDDEARAPSYGAHSALSFDGRDVAAKTGTTNDTRDAWVIGYTPTIAVGAWVGNNDNTPMVKKVAGQIVVPMWSDFMRQILPTLPNQSFVRPEPTPDDIAPVLRGVWQNPNGGVHSILYWIDRDNPRGPAPARPAADPQFRLWETPVLAWAAEHGYRSTGVQTPNRSSDSRATDSFRIEITKPASGTRDAGTQLAVTFSTKPTSHKVVKMDVYMNGALVGSTSATPLEFSFVPETVSGWRQGANTLKVVAYDESGRTAEDTKTFRLR